MSESPHFLFPERPSSEPPVAEGKNRYRLHLQRQPGGSERVRVEDRNSGDVLLEWSGPYARHLLQSGALPDSALRSADYACDKSFIRHLTLTCAAAKLAMDQIAELESIAERPRRAPRLRPVNSTREPSPTERLIERLDACGRRLPGPHLLVAKTLFERKGEHFSESDVVCLMSLECPSMRTSLVHTCLDDLTDWRVIQRIVIDADNVFYDIDMSPHLHVFDPAARMLTDAPSAGVLRINASQPNQRAEASHQ